MDQREEEAEPQLRPQPEEEGEQHQQQQQQQQQQAVAMSGRAPFRLLRGEALEALGASAEGALALTNYRLYLETGGQPAAHHVPLGLIEAVEVREMFYLHVGCKDARSYKCAFDNNETCNEWFRRILNAALPPRSIEDFFAFAFHAASVEETGERAPLRLGRTRGGDASCFKSEVERLSFNLHGAWRISQINASYKLCPSYPPLLLVPACTTDETLEAVARFRSSKRIPAVVWRHAGNGAIVARCSQPEVGWLGWRSAEDEDLLRAIADACAFDRGKHSMMECRPKQAAKKVLIMDARSYTTAVANRARGGGCECPEYYPSCDIQFMYLANIHSIRKSFHALRQLCSTPADQQTNWFSLLEGTRWLLHMSVLFRAAVTLAAAVEQEARPVLVHCSDGWDRTPQIVALAQLLLDPYYRTVEGFRILVEREWLAFGHKFADRCGHQVGADNQSERCPVFLQWLDCIHQLLIQFPCSFQFSQLYLVKLAQHTYSHLFGTFLCNTKQERVEQSVAERTFSVWNFLNCPNFKNHLYAPPPPNAPSQVLWPTYNVRDLRLWSEVYLGSLEERRQMKTSSVHNKMTKTRSYTDLMKVTQNGPRVRRNSDPSLSVEPSIEDALRSLTMESDAVTVDLNSEMAIFKRNSEVEPVLPAVTNNGQLVGSAPPTPPSPSPSPSPSPLVGGDINHNGQSEDGVTTSTDTLVPDSPLANGHCSSAPIVTAAAAAAASAAPPLPLSSLDEEESDLDGLSPLRSDVQQRLQQIMAEHRSREDALQRELKTTRLALIQRVCHPCSAGGGHANDCLDETGSMVESVGSLGEGGGAGGSVGDSSLPSDVSWEAMEEGAALADGHPTLWVPDHAVTCCTGCRTEFWLGRRKHHCRSCGKIFCADCSEYSTPLPTEHLYSPVRVCTGCYAQLRAAVPPQLLPQSFPPSLPQSLPPSAGSFSSSPPSEI